MAKTRRTPANDGRPRPDRPAPARSFRPRPCARFGVRGNAPTVDAGLALQRVVEGLAFVAIFEEVLPCDGVWGPQPWFVADVAEMGFPWPAGVAWGAVLCEFVGGLLLIAGLGTRLAAAANAVVTGVAAFLYHGGDVSGDGLLATVFFALCATLLIAGPGRFSLDGWFARPAAGA